MNSRWGFLFLPILLLTVGVVSHWFWPRSIPPVVELLPLVPQDQVIAAPLPAEEVEPATDQNGWYGSTTPMVIGPVAVAASLARTPAERALGLSGTPGLPNNVVKLFIFPEAGTQSIWMKDMLYALDILWLDRAGNVVHMEEAVRPESFPRSYGSPVPAWYVVEAVAGFVQTYDIKIGTKTTLPDQL